MERSQHLLRAAVWALAIALLVAMPSPVQSQDTDRLADACRDAFSRVVGETQVRCAAIVAIDGEVVFEHAAGPAHVDAEGERVGSDDVTTRHLFDLGSVTKHITAAAVLRLVDQKKLALDDEVVAVLGLPRDRAPSVTIRHVLGHTAGLPPASSLPGNAEHDRRAAAEAILAERSGVEPGAVFAYSNSGYQLLAAIVEHVGKKPFESFVERELFARAKLESATLCGGKPPRPAIATSRRSGDRVSSIAAFPSGFGRKGTTGALMSVRDFVRWDAALRAGRVLSDARRAEWGESGPGGYGLGWFVVDRADGLRVLEHGGSVEGYRSKVVRCPSRGVVVAVFGDEATPASAIADALRDQTLGISAASNVRFGARLGVIPATEDGYGFDCGRPWRFSIDQNGDVHGFCGPEARQAFPAAYFYVARSDAEAWVAALAAAGEQDSDDNDLDVIHRVVMTWGRPSVVEASTEGQWTTADHLAASVELPRAAGSPVRLVLRGKGASFSIELSGDAATRFRTDLAAVLAE
jgi:CubicO group peptidase (beta-lactamase class C family)